MTDLIERLEAAKVDQTIIGKDNPRGNCLQAAIATVMAIPLNDAFDATDPAVDPEKWHIEIDQWAAQRGWQIRSQRHCPSDEYCIAIGSTVRENGLHTVVFRDGQFWHDPHPDRSGLVRVRYYLRICPIAALRAQEVERG